MKNDGNECGLSDVDPQNIDPYHMASWCLWKRISVMVCEKSAYPNCSGRVITAPEDL